MTLKKNVIECTTVLFDLDGVLIDSTSCIERHWQEWAEKHEIDLNLVLQNAHGVRTIETILKVAPHLDAEKESELFTANEIQDTEGVVAIQGAKELISQLTGLHWAIVTSGGYDLVRARLNKAGLPFPPYLITGDDVTQGKPSPQPYLKGAEILNIAPEDCVVVEDAPIGIGAGKAAGMRVIGILSTYSEQELLHAGADFIVNSLQEINITKNGHLYILLKHS